MTQYSFILIYASICGSLSFLFSIIFGTVSIKYINIHTLLVYFVYYGFDTNFLSPPLCLRILSLSLIYEVLNMITHDCLVLATRVRRSKNFVVSLFMIKSWKHLLHLHAKIKENTHFECSLHKNIIIKESSNQIYINYLLH